MKELTIRMHGVNNRRSKPLLVTQNSCSYEEHGFDGLVVENDDIRSTRIYKSDRGKWKLYGSPTIQWMMHNQYQLLISTKQCNVLDNHGCNTK